MKYQVGGSLSFAAPSYIERQADKKLYEALKQGEFCYVLNSRQMGKSSLLIRINHRLKQEGFKCVIVDMTNISNKNLTPQQWYKSLIADLCLGFDLFDRINLKTWWHKWQDCSLTKLLSAFFDELVKIHFPQEQLFIFIDEIDSILNLNFSVDDFFTLIHFCYNQRAISPEYQYLTFAIFGVATPSDLIKTKYLTPFNIGQSIEISGFKQQEALPLAEGLELTEVQAQTILKEILFWTGGQPFLTQKICNLAALYVQHYKNQCLDMSSITVATFVETLVRKYIIDTWEFHDEPQHLLTIRDRIENSGENKAIILNIYQQILQGLPVKSDHSREKMELLLSGLVSRKKGLLKVTNQIYAEIFNLDWVQEQQKKVSLLETD